MKIKIILLAILKKYLLCALLPIFFVTVIEIALLYNISFEPTNENLPLRFLIAKKIVAINILIGSLSFISFFFYYDEKVYDKLSELIKEKLKRNKI